MRKVIAYKSNGNQSCAVAATGFYNCRHTTGSTAASTGELIAAAFVLNRQDYLPDYYSDMIEAWDRLGEEWQAYVRIIKQDCMHQIIDAP